MTTEFVSLYDEESGRTLGVLLMMSLGRKNERFNVKFFSVSLSVTTEFVSLYDEESGRTLGVLRMSLGRKNERFLAVTMETRCFRNKLEFQRYPPKDIYTARCDRKSSKKKFQTFQKPRKK